MSQLDALIEVLTAELNPGMEGRFSSQSAHRWTAALVDAVPDRVLQEIRHRTMAGKIDGGLALVQTNRVRSMTALLLTMYIVPDMMRVA